MGYKVQTKVRIDLSEFGTDNSGNGFFVEVSPLQVLPYEKKMNYLAASAAVFKGMDAEKIKNKDFSGFELDTEKISGMKKAIQGLIVSWNVVDFDDNPVDCKDADAFDRIPGFIVDAITTKINEASQPNDETKNS